MSIPILMYHEIERQMTFSLRDNHWDDQYLVKEDQFQSQMDRILADGYRMFTLDDWLDSPVKIQEAKSILLTFDDGWASDYQMVFPLFKKLGLTATFFPTVEKIGQEGYVTWEQLLEMSAGGMCVGSHTMTHRFLSDLSDGEIRWELEASKTNLERKLSCAVRHLSLPGGRNSPSLHRLAKSIGYQTVCTSKFGLSRLEMDPFSLKRLVMKRSTDLRRFESFLRHESLPMWKEQMLYAIKDQMKKVLNNTSYLRLREFTSRVRSLWLGERE